MELSFFYFGHLIIQLTTKNDYILLKRRRDGFFGLRSLHKHKIVIEIGAKSGYNLI